jgi:hypothetical protein
MGMRRTLEIEHDRVQAQCNRVEALLRSSIEPNSMFLGPVRDELARMLVQHIHFKEAMIYGPLRKDAPVSRLSTIHQMDALCAALYDDYQAHRAEWPDTRVGAQWHEYRTATIDLLERLDRAIQLERVHIYPLLTTMHPDDHGVQAA